MRIRENLSPILATQNNNNTVPNFKFQVGRVYSIILNENSPTKQLFDANGGWNGLGTVFYMDYDQSINTDNVNLNQCKTAKPFFPQHKYYPLLGELILIFDLPAANSQISNVSYTKYYINVLNLWNNIQHNANPTPNQTTLGSTFQERPNINSLQPFEGDLIHEGRFGNSIRLSSTSKNNPWSTSGEDGDPITIITNGHSFDPESTNPYTEAINNDSSSLYITSTQVISLQTDRTILDPLTQPIAPQKYSGAQIIINSDRVTLNSKKDEVMIFGKTGIDLYTNNIINIEAKERIVLNSGRIFLGLKDNKLPTEPVLLGNQTILLLNSLITELSKFTNKLSQAKSTPQGTPILDIVSAATMFGAKLQNIASKLQSIKSSNTYTA